MVWGPILHMIRKGIPNNSVTVKPRCRQVGAWNVNFSPKLVPNGSEHLFQFMEGQLRFLQDKIAILGNCFFAVHSNGPPLSHAYLFSLAQTKKPYFPLYITFILEFPLLGMISLMPHWKKSICCVPAILEWKPWDRPILMSFWTTAMSSGSTKLMLASMLQQKWACSWLYNRRDRFLRFWCQLYEM